MCFEMAMQLILWCAFSLKQTLLLCWSVEILTFMKVSIFLLAPSEERWNAEE